MSKEVIRCHKMVLESCQILYDVLCPYVDEWRWGMQIQVRHSQTYTKYTIRTGKCGRTQVLFLSDQYDTDTCLTTHVPNSMKLFPEKRIFAQPVKKS